jgi:hypothetical protein
MTAAEAVEAAVAVMETRTKETRLGLLLLFYPSTVI